MYAYIYDGWTYFGVVGGPVKLSFEWQGYSV